MAVCRLNDNCICVCVLQLAQDEGSAVRGFAVVEYETAEQAEAVLLEMDRQLIQGQEIRLSLCSPGTSGRSTLAALIAAQGVVSNTFLTYTLFKYGGFCFSMITADFCQIKSALCV